LIHKSLGVESANAYFFMLSRQTVVTEVKPTSEAVVT